MVDKKDKKIKKTLYQPKPNKHPGYTLGWKNNSAKQRVMIGLWTTRNGCSLAGGGWTCSRWFCGLLGGGAGGGLGGLTDG